MYDIFKVYIKDIMKLFGLEFRKASKKEISYVSAWGGSLQSKSKPMLLSTVYRCVDLISDSIAVLPLETYNLDAGGFKTPAKNNPIYHVLMTEPNEDMTRYVFFKTLVTSVLLRGNGYAYIERNSRGEPIQLIYIPSEKVTIEWINDRNSIRRKRYRIAEFSGLVEPKDMIHVLNFSYDGIVGVSTLTHAAQTIGIATDSESHAAGFFKSGGNISGVLSADINLNQEQKDQNYEEWERRTHPITGKPNGIVILSKPFKYEPISVSPKDSQLLESRLFNVSDICRFFSVSPVKAFDLTKSSYSTVEATQLQYLTDTALAVITKVELEINRKLFNRSEWGSIKSEFDTSALLRTDKSAQSEYWRKLFNIGAVTPNEVRREINMGKMENGDTAFIPVNVQPISMSGQPKQKKKTDDGKNV